MTAALILLGLAAYFAVSWLIARATGRIADQMGGPDDE